MSEQAKRKAYAARFIAYLVNELAEKELMEKIEKIILFGSVAKGESTKESDVDLFVDVKNIGVKKGTENLEHIVHDVVTGFYNSREALLFKAKGIDNKLNLIVGKLKDWKDIHRSIMSTGIILWGGYEEKGIPLGTKHNIIFYWNKIGKNRGAFLNTLYGFSAKGRHYEGLLDKFGGKRIGKSCIIIPVRCREETIALFKKYKVAAKGIEVFVG